MAKKSLPVHPGLFLQELMTEYGLTQYALAGAIGVQPIRIGHVVTGKRAITPDTALRLARYFGTDAQSWVNWQAHYDLQVAQRSIESKIKRDVQPVMRKPHSVAVRRTLRPLSRAPCAP